MKKKQKATFKKPSWDTVMTDPTTLVLDRGTSSKKKRMIWFFLTLKFPSHPVLLVNIVGRKYVLYNISTGSSTWMYILYLIIGTSHYICGIMLSMWTRILCIISRASYYFYRRTYCFKYNQRAHILLMVYTIWGQKMPLSGLISCTLTHRFFQLYP